MIIKKIDKADRTVVVERSNALVYLMTSLLELKVEGSNPGHPKKSNIFSECRDKNGFRDLFAQLRNLDLR